MFWEWAGAALSDVASPSALLRVCLKLSDVDFEIESASAFN